MVKTYLLIIQVVFLFVLSLTPAVLAEDEIPIIEVGETVRGNAGADTVTYLLKLNSSEEQVITVRLFIEDETSTLVIYDVANNTTLSRTLARRFEGHWAYRYALPASENGYHIRFSPNADYELRVEAGNTLYPTEVIPLPIGESVSGTSNPAGGILSVYTLDLDADQTVTIRIFSEEAITTLDVRDAADNAVSSDIVGSANFLNHHAYLYTLRAERAPYNIVIQPRTDYEIRVEVGDTLLDKDHTSISVGDTVTGIVDAESGILPTYTLYLEENQVITVRVGSDEVNNFPRLLDPNGTRIPQIETILAGGYANLAFNISETGIHTLTVNRAGEFILEVEEGNNLYLVQDPLTVGDVVTGTIDRQWHLFPLDVTPDSYIRIEIESLDQTFNFRVRDGDMRNSPIYISQTAEQKENTQSEAYFLRDPGPHTLFLGGIGDYRLTISDERADEQRRLAAGVFSVGSAITTSFPLSNNPLHYILDADPGTTVTVRFEALETVSYYDYGTMFANADVYDSNWERVTKTQVFDAPEFTSYRAVPPIHYQSVYTLEGTPPFMLSIMSNYPDYAGIEYLVEVVEGDQISEVFGVTSGETVAIGDIISGRLPVDDDAILIYELDASPGDMFTIEEVIRNPRNHPVRISFRDGNNEIITEEIINSRIPTRPLKVYTVPENGPYTLVIDHIPPIHINPWEEDPSTYFTLALIEGDIVREFRTLSPEETIVFTTEPDKIFIHNLDAPPGLYLLILETDAPPETFRFPQIYRDFLGEIYERCEVTLDNRVIVGYELGERLPYNVSMHDGYGDFTLSMIEVKLDDGEMMSEDEICGNVEDQIFSPIETDETAASQ